jgi:hypothetical protein
MDYETYEIALAPGATIQLRDESIAEYLDRMDRLDAERMAEKFAVMALCAEFGL